MKESAARPLDKNCRVWSTRQDETQKSEKRRNQNPLTASQRAGLAAAGIATKTIGAMHGEGGVTVPSKRASPVVVAGVLPATRLTTVGAPPASMLWQLRITAKFGIG